MSTVEQSVSISEKDLAPEPAPASEKSPVPDPRLFYAQVRMMYATANPGVMHTLLVLIVGWMYWGIAEQNSLLLWLGVMLTISMIRLAIVQAFVRREPGDDELDKWDSVYLVAVFVTGIAWGTAGFLLYPPDNTVYQVALAFVIGGISSSATASLAARQIAVVFAVCPALLIASFRFLFDSTEGHLEMGILLLLYLAVLMNIGRAMHRQIIDALSLRFENQNLVQSLESTVSDLEVAQREAEQSSRAKTRFLASASHDLRQPVHAMILFVAALARRQADDKQSQELVGKIDRSLDSVKGLLDSLLDISKLDANIVHVRNERLDVRTLLDQVVNEFAGEAEGKGLHLRAAGQSIFVDSDLVLLGRVVRNLTANAVRYTETGGILIAVRKRGSKARIEIWDTGIGIKDEDQREIFQEFFQLRTVSEDQQGGLGLGLSIVKRTCDLLQCPLEVISEPGSGSRFLVTLPLSSDQSHAVPRVDMDVLEARVSDDKPHILLVEDDPQSADAMRGLLESWGYKCALAERIEAIDDAVADLDGRIDLVVSDYRLPEGETGDLAAAKVRAVVGENMPVLIVTGDTGPDRLLDLRGTGFDLLHKPVQPAELRAMVRHLLG